MTLDKIKLANKKFRHERKRNQKRVAAAIARKQTRITRRRTKKLFAEGRREHLKQRREETNYIKTLESELADAE